MSQVKVSALVRAYNREKYIAQTIQSILRQTFQDFEIVVVDDGSTDSTKQVVAGFSDPRIRYFSQRNQGQTVAMNTGVREACGEYLAILDSDDLWLPTMLETAVRVLDTAPGAGLFSARASAIDENGDPLPQLLGCPIKYHDQPMKSLLYGDSVSPATILIRRSCFGKVGLFDEALNGAEDWEMWIRIARHYQILFYDGVLAKYRFHLSNYTGTRANVKHILDVRLKVLDKTFADPTLPELIASIKPLAYRNVYLELGLRSLTIGAWSDSSRYFWNGLRVAPNFLVAVFRIAYIIAFHKVFSRIPATSRAIAWLVARRRR